MSLYQPYDKDVICITDRAREFAFGCVYAFDLKFSTMMLASTWGRELLHICHVLQLNQEISRIGTLTGTNDETWGAGRLKTRR